MLGVIKCSFLCLGFPDCCAVGHLYLSLVCFFPWFSLALVSEGIWLIVTVSCGLLVFVVHCLLQVIVYYLLYFSKLFHH